MSPNLDSFLKDTKKEEGVGGGNGFIAQIKVEFGYKLYITGMSNDESWLPYTAGDEKSKKDAHESAIANYVGSGVSEEDAKKKLSKSSVAIIIKNGTVLNRQTTWQGDQYFVNPIWSKAYLEVVEPSLSGKIKDTSDLGKWHWGWVKFMPDPSGRTRTVTTKNEDGSEKSEERQSMVAYVEEIFPTKVAAVARAAEVGGENDATEDSGNEITDVPEGFTIEEWKLAAGDIKKAHAAGKSAFALSKDYGVAISFIKAIID